LFSGSVGTKQNQTITKCFSKFGTKPNPNPTQTESNPKELEPVATLEKIYRDNVIALEKLYLNMNFN
jgi:hypothetical protein